MHICALQSYSDMDEHGVNLLDLPAEILFIILKKLDNIDVLYSLLGVDSQRLDIVVQDRIFTTTLNFFSISQSTNGILSSDSIFDRFSKSILPKIHRNIKSLILEFGSIECILRAAHYPNLEHLELFNFKKAILSRHFVGKKFISIILFKR